MTASMTETPLERTSSLLQLPRNIRDRIWSHAYGSLVLHAGPSKPDQKPNPSGAYAFRYYLCESSPPTTQSPQTTECCTTPAKTNGTRPPFFWPIVNKQFWLETTQTLYASAVFKVHSSIDMYILASSQQQSVRRMRYLEAHLGLGIKHHARIWSASRCGTVTPNFQSLRGLTLVICRVGEDSEDEGTLVHDRGTRLADNEPRNAFPVFLRAFQPLHLQPESTHVFLFDRGAHAQRRKAPEYHPRDHRWGDDPYREHCEETVVRDKSRGELAERIRAVLLGRDSVLLVPEWEPDRGGAGCRKV